MNDNKDVSCFLVTKHSWKGKYRRIFSVGTSAITTYNPMSLEVTNQWPYDEICNIKPVSKAGALQSEFVMTIKKKAKTDAMRFSSDYTAELLSEAARFNGFKYHWSETRVSIILEVSSASLRQLHMQSGKLLAEYCYKDMREVIRVSDCPGGFILAMGDFRRLHLFASQSVDEILQMVSAAAHENVSVPIRFNKEGMSLHQFWQDRIGRQFRSDLYITSLVEFTVQKHTHRSNDPVRRLLCLTEKCLLERDPSSYSIITIKSLGEICCLVRWESNPQHLDIEYNSSERRSYSSNDRDNLLASLLDGVRASGNNDIHVRCTPTNRSFRWTPPNVCLDEDAESLHLKFICTPPSGIKLSEAIGRFNSNVPYSGLLYSVTQDGLFSENKEKLIVACLSSIVDQNESSLSVDDWIELFHCLHRLFASKAGFHSFTNVPRLRETLGNKIISAFKLQNEAVDHAAIDALCALMQPMHSNYEIRQEQLNKSSLLSSKPFLEHLMDMMVMHVTHGTGTLVICSMLDFLTYALCVPYSETTHGDQFDNLLNIVTARGRLMFKLFQYPSMTIVKGAGLVMRAIIEESDSTVSKQMQTLALAEGALLRHFHTALFTQSKDIRMLTNQQLSRHLTALWSAGNEDVTQLMKRTLPIGLLNYLSSKDPVPSSDEDLLLIRNNLSLAISESDQKKNQVIEQIQDQWNQVQKVMEKQLDSLLLHWKLRQNLNFMRKEDKSQKPVILRKRRERVKITDNWKLFFYHFNKDHCKADLIWNHKTREELRESLENELRMFTADRELTMAVPISWNHVEFEVLYPSLSNEIRIGDYYLRVLLDEDKAPNSTPTPILNPSAFFNEVYHHFLLNTKAEMRSSCLQALSITYGRYHEDIGPFLDTKYVISMLDKSSDFLERDRLLMFVNKLILHRENVKEILNAGGIRVLVDLLTLAHLHTSRAYVPTQTNVIEASADMSRDGSAEWYYNAPNNERRGPFSFDEMKEAYKKQEIVDKTKCWAHGLDGWRPFAVITQFRWTVVASNSAAMNESELASLVLDVLIKMCQYYPSRDEEGYIIRPVPKVKRLLADPAILPHIVQLLLTFDPILVEKCATLLHLIMQENPVMSRLYLTGVFFFILMYSGSNVLPIANFLLLTHMKQAFRSEQAKSDIFQQSVLSPILPEAAIFYLENYGAEKYAEVFIGEFDNPEVIWNSEMRRQMIEKLAVHVSDFSIRLPSNIRALYQYCPIPLIAYPQLETEIFCYIYYLRHLCDSVRFPNWAIKEPVAFLKACLLAWTEEVERKPPTMTVSDALSVLQLTLDDYKNNEAIARKAYFKLAQQFHPDKNPEGREAFEAINQAYEFLCSKSSKSQIGPDPERIMLCIKAQSIVYNRHSTELAPYKYAGYTQLIKTIRLETEDDYLFSKNAPLLACCAELCYYTVRCSALNAEQLRRENGLEALQDAVDRCIGVLSQSSKPSDLAVQVCLNVCLTYATAAQFLACREKIAQMPGVFADICRILNFSHLSKLCTVAAECIAAFCVDPILQTKILEAGVLWQLLSNLFSYDYTLDYGGVQKAEESNQQELANNLARVSCEACASLAGFRENCPENKTVLNALAALLTPYVVRLLKKCSVNEVLKLLNSNSENPYIIWNNGTRAELMEYVVAQQKETTRTTESFGADFKQSSYETELIIGDIFVRVYNAQPRFVLEEPKHFCVALLDFLNAQAQYLHSLLSLNQTHSLPSNNDRLKHIEMALEALRNVLRSNPGVEILLIGHFKLLFALLAAHTCAGIQFRALEVFSLATVNEECVNDIAACGGLVNLLVLTIILPQHYGMVLSVCTTLASSPKIVKDYISLGGLIYFLDLLCNSDDGDVRIATAELLAKMLADKLNGPRCRLLLMKFLPPIFMDAMRDAPRACVDMFDGTSENPELIWNEDTRKKVSETVRTMMTQHYEKQRFNFDEKWKLPENFSCVYEDVTSGEIMVAGVFLRLFIANPSWVLRNSRQFLTELLDYVVAEMQSTTPLDERLDTLTTALVALLQNQPAIADQIPAQGYLTQFISASKNSNPVVSKACILVIHQLSRNKLCAEHLAKVDCLAGLMKSMKTRPDLLHSACQSLRCLFEKDSALLVDQALKCGLVEFLLFLLDGAMTEVENPSATKAEIVNALKSMTLNLEFGDAVSQILAKSTVWAEFKDQKHDLFIQSTQTAGYLTAGAGMAGYLTQGINQQRLQAMPPP